MHLRSTVLAHPSGLSIKTPLLVPSFSSKGFKTSRTVRRMATKARATKAQPPRGKSEIRKIFGFASEFITESMLVSAYDIYYGHLPDPKRFKPTPAITIVDSGGYETGVGDDLSAIYRFPCQHNSWTEAMLKQVYDTWPETVPAVFVNYDKGAAGKALSFQIDRAKKFLNRYPQQLHSFLVKPEIVGVGGLRETIMSNISLLPLLSDVDIVGVTEKELGSSVIERMLTIAILRQKLDGAGVGAPIQVFGALDPLSSCLFFVAGAEIFDGLTWLRFAYRSDLCVYIANHGALSEGGLSAEEDRFKAKIIADNYYYLANLQLRMATFVTDQNFDHLPHAECLRFAFQTIEGKLQGGV